MKYVCVLEKKHGENRLRLSGQDSQREDGVTEDGDCGTLCGKILLQLPLPQLWEGPWTQPLKCLHCL